MLCTQPVPDTGPSAHGVFRTPSPQAQCLADTAFSGHGVLRSWGVLTSVFSGQRIPRPRCLPCAAFSGQAQTFRPRVNLLLRDDATALRTDCAAGSDGQAVDVDRLSVSSDQAEGMLTGHDSRR